MADRSPQRAEPAGHDDPGQGLADERLRRAVCRLPLPDFAHLLVEMQLRSNSIFLTGTPGERPDNLLLELLYRHPARLSLVELSVASGVPIAEVLRSVRTLAHEGLIELASGEPTLRDREIGLAALGRQQIEQHLEATLHALSDLVVAQAHHAHEG